MQAFEEILDVLPPRYKDLDLSGVCEVHLRARQAPSVLQDGRERRLGGLVTREELSGIVQRATGCSLYACRESLRAGFLTLPGGHRIGLCGQVVVKDGAVTGFSSISSLCIRLARDVRLDEKKLLPGLQTSTLIIGPPGSGKTTLLRACIRALSFSGQRVCLADERGEVAAEGMGAAGFDLGPQTDVLTGGEKSQAMMMLLRAMSPGWIAADEITESRDIAAMGHISYCGVKLLATAHAENEDELSKRPLYRELLSLGVFRHLFVLRPDKSWYEAEVAG